VGSEDIQFLNDMEGYLSYKPCYLYSTLMKCEEKIILLNTGNQAGKNDTIARHYVSRLLGQHPVESKNMRPNTSIRILRFCAETLPNEPDGAGEVRNTVYPAFKKRLPPGMIKKDITMRKPVMTLYDPQGGAEIYAEFVSYGQQVQSQAGVQRWSCYLDEQSSLSFYHEQIPRLMAANGDIVIGLTPTEGLSWVYEEVYERASVIYNSPYIRWYMKTVHKKPVPEVERFIGRNTGIAVIRAATDDNPTFIKEQVDEKMMMFDGYDYEVRRYGIFFAISGQVYKEFDARMNSGDQFGHVISRNKYFQDGIPHDWNHARGIDFHPHVNWACGWIALSPQNEAFIYQEYNPSPDRNVTSEIMREVAIRSGEHRFSTNLVDPLAEVQQANTGLTPLHDMNRAFSEYRKQRLCSGGFWETWDTKNERGYDIIKERLRNARICGRPFNNRVVKDGVERFLPTIWILDTCPITIQSFRNWRWEEWANKEMLQTKDEKNKRQDRYSHFPVTHECIFKHPAFGAKHKVGYVDHRKTGYENYLRGAA